MMEEHDKTLTTTMTQLLEQAIEQIKTLPNDVQDAIASRLLAEMEDEASWQSKFELTTDQQWDQMAKMVFQEIASGETIPLDEVSDL